MGREEQQGPLGPAFLNKPPLPLLSPQLRRVASLGLVVSPSPGGFARLMFRVLFASLAPSPPRPSPLAPRPSLALPHRTVRGTLRRLSRYFGHVHTARRSGTMPIVGVVCSRPSAHSVVVLTPRQPDRPPGPNSPVGPLIMPSWASAELLVIDAAPGRKENRPVSRRPLPVWHSCSVSRPQKCLFSLSHL